MDASHSEDTPRKNANSLERSSKSHHGLSEKYTNNCTRTRVKSTAVYCKKRPTIRLCTGNTFVEFQMTPSNQLSANTRMTLCPSKFGIVDG